LRRRAGAAGERERGGRLEAQLRARLDAVQEAMGGRPRPRVVALEWLDPVYVGGHWVPEMIELAGGTDVLGRAGEKSRVVPWEEVSAAEPEVVVVMPCGLYAAEAEEEARRHRSELRASGAERIAAVDAASSFSRPGPRLVDGVELLASILHPGSVAAPRSVAARPLPDLAAPRARSG
jgi:iron complex transport system substrate-binding protein